MPRPTGALRSLIAIAAGLGLALAARADDRPLRATIDTYLRAAWEREKVKPAGKAADAEFLRRASLDLVGTIPTADEVRQFLADADPKKREKLIDRLLADPRFARQQADVWDLVLFGRRPPNGDAVRNRDRFKAWLADQFAKNVPYDQWVGDLLRADKEGPELFLIQYRYQLEDAAIAVARTFLGTQIHCAKCHDHPFDKWTQKDFYGMAGFLVRVVVAESGSGADRKFMVGEKSTGEVLFSGAAKDQQPGRKGDPVKPKFLGGPELDEPPVPKDFKEPFKEGAKTIPKPTFSRKEKLAAWLTAADNPYFAKAAANRVWAQFLGRGLVHPVDDLKEKTASKFADLLDTVAKELAAHKFDLKWLIRELANTEAYQLAGAGAGKDALPAWFERARIRPLSAEELVTVMRAATGYDADPKAAGKPLGSEVYFVLAFGEPTNGLGEFQGSLSEHLFLNNSEHVQRLISRKPGNLVDYLVTSKDAPEAKVDRLFLTVLSRPPTDAERKRFAEHLGGKDKPEALAAEAVWALMNTAGFRFNH